MAAVRKGTHTELGKASDHSKLRPTADPPRSGSIVGLSIEYQE
jgi:hypothetical protein